MNAPSLLSPSAVRPAAGLLAQARACRREGRSAQAEALLLHLLEQYPGSATAQLELGNLRKAEGRFREALGPLREAVRLAPGEGAGWLNLGVAQLELDERTSAVESFQQAIRLEPSRAEAHNVLGHALLLQGKSGAAAAHLQEALRLRPGYAAAHDNLGRVLKHQGRADEALAQHRAALAASPKAATHSNLLYTLNLLNLPPDQILTEHLQWAERYGAAPVERDLRARLVADRVAAPNAASSRRLRIGYVSPDFCHHAVAYFFEPVLEHHDRAQFEIFAYSDVRAPDQVTARLRGHAEHWRDCSRLTDEALCAAVRADGIDVLVDLAGHTAGNRLTAFARRPAPVQVTWLGYPNTTGLNAMDYRITDGWADPGGTERWHSETLLRLPGPFSCYRPPDESPEVTAPPAIAAGEITFGCFNHVAKINEALIYLWAAVLKAVPDSRMVLKSRGLGDAATLRHLRGQFAAAGIAAERIEFLGQELSVRDHLALYGRIDIALDAYPYNGATTTCEALWMGVPVVTLAGQTHVSRVGASMLTHAGCAEGIAYSSDDYVRVARELAADLPGLDARRATQRDRMRHSPLCDGPGFTRNLEDAWRTAHAEKFAASASMFGSREI